MSKLAKFRIVIASGKGGVGKSMLTSSLAMLFNQTNKVIAADCDVDAPNLHLWLGLPVFSQAMVDRWDKIEKISTNEMPIIDKKKCNLCGQCVDICVFKALSITQKKLLLNRYFCEGCGACQAVCPQKAIKMKKINNAEIRIKNNIQGFPLISAQLYPGQTGSGKIVEEIKKRVSNYKWKVSLLDSPAGIGCPVIAAINGTDFALLITEPTPSGISDLKRVLQVVDHFKIPFGIVINKWDINTQISNKIEQEYKNKLFGKITYDQRIFKAISKLKPIVNTNLPVKKEIKKIYKRLSILL